MVNLKNVIKIGKERIKYKNGQGNDAYVELASCVNTWAYRHSDMARDGELRCVGDLISNADGMYIEFYNIGHVKIGVSRSLIQKLFNKPLSPKQTKCFNEFQKTLEANGYTAYKIQ